MNWLKMLEDLGIGGVAGALDQWVQNSDDKRALADSTEAAPGKLAFQSQYGTYVNYGLPLVDVCLVGFGVLKGDWATRLTTVSGQLVGRKLVHKYTDEKHLPGYPGSDNKGWPQPASYNAWTEQAAARQQAAARAAALEQSRQRALGGAAGRVPQLPGEIPVLSGEEILS